MQRATGFAVDERIGGALPFLAALPLVFFLGKPLHVDDPLYVWVAEQVLRDPGDFYGFDLNWVGVRAPFSQEMMNPPLAGYLLAAAGALLGFEEPRLHAVMLLPALAAAAAIARLARCLGLSPVGAVLLALWSPAVFVSGTTLMAEPWLLACFCGAVATWVEGEERQRPALRWLAVLLACLASLAKYVGLALVPLLFAHGLWRRRRLGAWALPLALPLLAMGAYEGWAASLYGASPLLRAGAYAAVSRSETGGASWSRLAVGLSFLGGSQLPAALFAVALFGRRGRFAFAGLAAAVAAALLASDGLGRLSLGGPAGLRGFSAAQAVLFISAGIVILALAGSELYRQRDALAALLALWTAGLFGYAVFLNWTVSVRALAPAAPAVSLLVLRAANDRWRATSRRGGRILAVVCGASLALSLAVAHADLALARSARRAATELVARHAEPGRRVWFQGAWGFQYYAERAGAKKVDRGGSVLRPGDVLLIPVHNSVRDTAPLPEHAPLAERVLFPAARFAASMAEPLGAGFYSDRWGPLPFVFGGVPPEPYDVYVVRQPLALRKERAPASSENGTAGAGREE